MTTDSGTQPRRSIVIVGAGPGVSGSLARLYAAKGYDIGLIGNDESVLAALTGELTAAGARVRSAAVDLTDTEAASAALTDIAAAFGEIRVLHFNPSAYREKNPLELSAADLLSDVALGIGALLTAVQAVRPYLAAGSRVTVTGSMAADQPWSGAASLGVQKAGLRNLVLSLDDVLAPHGIRSVSLTVRGTLAPEGPFSPARVAQALWDAAHQDEAGWRAEVPYTG